MNLYRERGLVAVLQVVLDINSTQYFIYGDETYMLRPWLQNAFSRLNLMAEELLYNLAVSAVREVVA